MGIAAADFNGDGKTDLAVANFNDDNVSILLGNGDGTFRGPTSVSLQGASPVSIVAADFDGDGKPDLAVALGIPTPSNASINILLGSGDGTFRSKGVFSNGTGTSSPVFAAVGDFNADGIPDIVVLNLVNGPGPYFSILLGNGDGTFQAPLTNESFACSGNSCLEYRPSGVAIGDFDGDGKSDLAIAEDYGNSLHVFRGKGDGTFESPTSYTVSQAISVATADLNGDGTPDLAVAASPGQ